MKEVIFEKKKKLFVTILEFFYKNGGNFHIFFHFLDIFGLKPKYLMFVLFKSSLLI